MLGGGGVGDGGAGGNWCDDVVDVDVDDDDVVDVDVDVDDVVVDAAAVGDSVGTLVDG